MRQRLQLSWGLECPMRILALLQALQSADHDTQTLGSTLKLSSPALPSLPWEPLLPGTAVLSTHWCLSWPHVLLSLR